MKLLAVSNIYHAIIIIVLPSLRKALAFQNLWGIKSQHPRVCRHSKNVWKPLLSSTLSEQPYLDDAKQGLWESEANDEDTDDTIVLNGPEGADYPFDSLNDEDDTRQEDDVVVDPLIHEFRLWSKAIDESLSNLEKKQNSLENELKKAEKIEQTVSRAQLITSYLYLFGSPSVKSAVVQDWEQDGKEVELILDPVYDSAAAEADALFQQARKLRRGSKVVGDLLKETNEAVTLLKDMKIDLESALSSNEETGVLSVNQNLLRFIQDRLRLTSSKTKFTAPSALQETGKTRRQQSTQNQKKAELGTPASNIRKLTSPAGCTIVVGRNRRGNEYLTFNIARGDDIWMHSRGVPGAHVLILQRRGGPKATDACLQFAADLAIFYSDSRSERKAEVTAVEPKHLLKPRGAPLGAVKCREEWKVFVGYPDNVPDELKEAREQAGQSDEFRQTDKAKHRKRNREAAAKKQSKAKKKKFQS